MLRTTGMRVISASQRRSHHWPTMFATKTPVPKMMTVTKMTPSPGTRRSWPPTVTMPGITASSALSTLRKMPLRMPINHSSTQAVIAAGSQTSRPVTKY